MAVFMQRVRNDRPADWPLDRVGLIDGIRLDEKNVVKAGDGEQAPELSRRPPERETAARAQQLVVSATEHAETVGVAEHQVRNVNHHSAEDLTELAERRAKLVACRVIEFAVESDDSRTVLQGNVLKTKVGVIDRGQGDLRAGIPSLLKAPR
jgi:hypothetical protein